MGLLKLINFENNLSKRATNFKKDVQLSNININFFLKVKCIKYEKKINAKFSQVMTKGI